MMTMIMLFLKNHANRHFSKKFLTVLGTVVFFATGSSDRSQITAPASRHLMVSCVTGPLLYFIFKTAHKINFNWQAECSNAYSMHNSAT